ncbi:MAG TPA: DNA polymerase IV, partial [Salinimicrobium sp.]|nr:DNA polymerase IV [Salinimicrobium sp.]
RPYGVRSAMSSITAKKLCPDLIFVYPRFDRYKEISRQIRRIFHQYTDLVEPLSLDEAYLDVTENKTGNPSATLIAEEIRKKILEKTGLTASAGISINKFIAKIASDINKPNGQKTVNPEEIESFLEELEIRKFFGVGKVTAEKMYQLGIFTGKDLKNKDLEFLTEHFKKSGTFYYDVVRGNHFSEVKSSRIQKSLGAEHTFEENISSEIFMLDKLKIISEELENRLKKYLLAGKTITLKIKYSDFSLQTRSKTFPYFISENNVILEVAQELLFQEKMRNSVRLLGISLSNLNTGQKAGTDEKDEIAIQLKFDL